WATLRYDDLSYCIRREQPEASALDSLESCGALVRNSAAHSFAPLLSQLSTRFQRVVRGPELHLFVVSLRCDHSCGYCQVSRQEPQSARFDMDSGTAVAAVE